MSSRSSLITFARRSTKDRRRSPTSLSPVCRATAIREQMSPAMTRKAMSCSRCSILGVTNGANTLHGTVPCCAVKPRSDGLRLPCCASICQNESNIAVCSSKLANLQPRRIEVFRAAIHPAISVRHSRNSGCPGNRGAISGAAKTRTRFTKSSNCVRASVATTGETSSNGTYRFALA